MPRGRGRYDYPKEIKNLALEFLERGHTAKEVRDRIFNLNYDPPSIKTILQWWHKEHPDVPRPTHSITKPHVGNVFKFTGSNRVTAWLNQQNNIDYAVNTVLEWYLRELQLEKRRERARERREKKKKGVVD